MPQEGDFERLVRRRMRKIDEPPRERPAFERLTRSAKLALGIAREEAEARWAPEIGLPHLLAGLAAEVSGVAARALRTAGVDRATIARELLGGPRPERAQAEPIPAVPSESVRRALELAFAEASGMGSPFVGTEHLLLGALAEAESSGADLLEALGLSVARARGEVERALRTTSTAAHEPSYRPWMKPRSNEVEWVLEEALRRALEDDDAVVVGLSHLVAALAAHPSGEALLADRAPR